MEKLKLRAVQAELRARRLDGWLFYDHHHRDPIAYRILGLSPALMVTRRWYYFVPARGAARKLVHRIESGHLDTLPGTKRLYAGWRDLDRELPRLLHGARRVAMQYSPECRLPAISLADAGTVEQLRALGCRPLSSGDLITRFDALWSASDLAGHRRAGRAVHAAIDAAFAHAGAAARRRRRLDEWELQQFIVARLRAASLIVEEPPIVAVGPHAGDPHYEPRRGAAALIAPGSLLLLDVWAKFAGGVYYDVTWMGYLSRQPGEAVPPRYARAFARVAAARDAGIELVQTAAATGRHLRGWQVDAAVRRVLERAGVGRRFVHRTGHSLGAEVHGSGPNLDAMETRDERELQPGVGFTIEPGVYYPDFGIRSEVNLYLDARKALITGPVQREIVRI